MNAEIAYNLNGLDPSQVLQKIKAAHDAVLLNAATFTTPSPTPASVLTSHNNAKAVIDQITALDQTRKNLMVQRDAALEVAVGMYKNLGTYVENKAAGNPATITLGGFDVAQPRGTAAPMAQVLNNALTAGDNDGEADAIWQAERGAKSYEIQTATVATGPYTHEATVTRSHHHLTGKPSATKLWTRVRAVNKLGPGPWSDPAVCTIP